MDNFETLTVKTDNRGVVTLTLARPEKHNAMNSVLLSELTKAAVEIGKNTDVRVCILAAQGPTFCAGADLGWMRDQLDKSREGKMAESSKLSALLQSLDDLPMPLIGKIQGSAFGGGVGLMAVCDTVVAIDSVKFALTETRLGLIPATIGPFVIRRIGEAWARQYYFSSKPFGSKIAKKMNLVSKIVSVDELDAIVEEEITHILKCKPGAVIEAKSLTKMLARNPTMETHKYTAEKLADRWETSEARDAISSFFETRN